MPVGVSHAPPAMNAWLYDSMALLFNALYRSTAICDRYRLNLRILLTRKSSWLIRSPYFSPGLRRLTFANAALPESGRPSDCATVADGTLKLAASSSPGRL